MRGQYRENGRGNKGGMEEWKRGEGKKGGMETGHKGDGKQRRMGQERKKIANEVKEKLNSFK
ncbi:hypothetical protein GCM10027036_31400 [Flavihumibacter cheonanensis]